MQHCIMHHAYRRWSKHSIIGPKAGDWRLESKRKDLSPFRGWPLALALGHALQASTPVPLPTGADN